MTSTARAISAVEDYYILWVSDARRIHYCRRPIRMSLLCQIDMTLLGGFAELAYEPSVLKRARSNNGSGFVGRCIGWRAGAALRRGSAPVRHPTPTMVTSLSGRNSDICIGRTQLFS